MKILSIDTSCDETACSATNDTQVTSSVVWSQATLHAKFGGVMPSLAQRQHEERIDYVVEKAVKMSKNKIENFDAIAVTVGPGLGIALGVGIKKAKELAIKYKKPLIPINHIEGHLFSAFANSKEKIEFPAYGLVLSGGTTLLCLVKDVGSYEMLAETSDDALGEALDKGARLLGLGYPGGAILEKLAKTGDSKKYELPLPLQNDRIKNRFSYSGLKTAFVRLFNSINDPTKQDIANLAASFQDMAFKHIEKILDFQIKNNKLSIKHLTFGGGVANNIEIKKRIRKLCKKNNIKFHVPTTKKLNGDNAAMIGVCAYLKYKDADLNQFYDYNSIDRKPRFKIN